MSRCLPPRPGSTGTARMGERWRPVPASRMFRIPAGAFEASSEGRVRVTGREPLAGSPDDSGYLRVGWRRRKFYVHVLVILAWQGEPQVRHLTGDNRRNKPTELAWGSKRENERDKDRNRRGGKGEVSPPSARLQPITGDVAG